MVGLSRRMSFRRRGGGLGGASSVDGAEKLTLLVQLFLTQHLLVAMAETSHTRTAFSITNTKFSVTQPVLFYQLFNPVFLLFHSFTQYKEDGWLSTSSVSAFSS